MSDEAIRFHCKAEIGGRISMPGGEGFLGGKMIKAAVDLNGGEISGVKIKPSRFRKFGRIKDPLPVFVMPAACSDKDLAFRTCNYGI